MRRCGRAADAETERSRGPALLQGEKALGQLQHREAEHLEIPQGTDPRSD